ncbi:hypothetical protein [Stigmatella aurantiaca]|nr:hypothetical protein [Stigmatella aurantiaca]
MDATRVMRRPEGRQTAGEATRIVRNPGGGRKPPAAPAPLRPVMLPLFRFALVALVLGKERAPALLDGLGVREAVRAKEHLDFLVGLSSAERQARVALEFGGRRDSAEQLRALMQEAPEALRRELFQRLPPYHQSLFPERAVSPVAAPVVPGLGAFAERLIREATR